VRVACINRSYSTLSASTARRKTGGSAAGQGSTPQREPSASGPAYDSSYSDESRLSASVSFARKRRTPRQPWESQRGFASTSLAADLGGYTYSALRSFVSLNSTGPVTCDTFLESAPVAETATEPIAFPGSLAMDTGERTIPRTTTTRARPVRTRSRDATGPRLRHSCNHQRQPPLVTCHLMPANAELSRWLTRTTSHRLVPDSSAGAQLAVPDGLSRTRRRCVVKPFRVPSPLFRQSRQRPGPLAAAPGVALAGEALASFAIVTRRRAPSSRRRRA
jgi:hypothetical protein